MYCSPEVIVKPAVTQASELGHERWDELEVGRQPWRRARVAIWNTVDILPSQVGAGCTVPPATWMTSTPMLSTRSRLTTTAVIQNGITLS